MKDKHKAKIDLFFLGLNKSDLYFVSCIWKQGDGE